MTDSSDEPRVRRERLSALTALRFFAAFYVVLYHAFPAHHAEGPGAAAAALRAWSSVHSHGFAAVGFFFTLSGFILAFNYPDVRSFSKPQFYRARFARVYPVYALGLLVALPFLVVRTLREHSWGHAAVESILAFSLSQAWFPGYWNAINIPGWSLSVEAFLYLSFPRVVGPLARAAANPARAWAMLALLFSCALVGPVIGTWCFGVTRGADSSLIANFFRYSPPFALPEFAFGILLGQMRLRGLDAPRQIARLYVPALLLLVLVLASDVVPHLLLHNGVLSPLFAIIILRCSHGDDVAWLLRRPWLVSLGEASYSLYVLHLPLWIYVKIVLERSGFDPLAAWVFPVYAAIAIAASLGSHAWLEQPARRWLYPAPPRRSANAELTIEPLR